jgi:hypothetical protein
MNTMINDEELDMRESYMALMMREQQLLKELEEVRRAMEALLSEED